MTVIISIITVLQAYIFKWMIPAHGDLTQMATATAVKVNLANGVSILAGTIIVIIILAVIVASGNRSRGSRGVYTPGK